MRAEYRGIGEAGGVEFSSLRGRHSGGPFLRFQLIRLLAETELERG